MVLSLIISCLGIRVEGVLRLGFRGRVLCA